MLAGTTKLCAFLVLTPLYFFVFRRFDPEFETLLTAAEDDPNNAKCNGDLGCILDTVALGDEAGDAYLNEPVILEAITAEIIESPPAPTPPPVPPPTPSGGDSERNESSNQGATSNGDPHCE